MRTKFDFDFVTTATPDQVIELMTDFSPNRPHRWPASSVKAFEVYHLGETEADIREGRDFPKLWATMIRSVPAPSRRRYFQSPRIGSAAHPGREPRIHPTGRIRAGAGGPTGTSRTAC